MSTLSSAQQWQQALEQLLRPEAASPRVVPAQPGIDPVRAGPWTRRDPALGKRGFCLWMSFGRLWDATSSACGTEPIARPEGQTTMGLSRYLDTHLRHLQIPISLWFKTVSFAFARPLVTSFLRGMGLASQWLLALVIFHQLRVPLRTRPVGAASASTFDHAGERHLGCCRCF